VEPPPRLGPEIMDVCLARSLTSLFEVLLSTKGPALAGLVGTLVPKVRTSCFDFIYVIHDLL
jgi:hypothetical protein